ncbi:MAG: efflux transporter, family, subunit [Bryobacterales bacterium]|jgi:HlyD family secretion protein|nr:efflux transporter, family, subunit [Bryobacterales bacterium]
MQTDTELKSLRIDRTRKGSSEQRPVGKYVAIGLIAVLVIGGGLFAYQKLTAAIPVKTVQVQSPTSAAAATSDQPILTVTGYIIAAHKIEVASKVVGRVAWIGVEKGDKVRAGQTIVRLEDDEYRAQLLTQQGQLANLQAKLLELRNGSRPEEIAKAKADRDEAQADLENAKVSLNRTKQLAGEGVLAKQALDDAQAKHDGMAAKVTSLQRSLDLSVLGPRQEQIAQVQGQIDQARGGLEYAQTQVDNTLIKAPVTGTILDRNVERGEFVTNGFVGDKGAKGYLVTMADLNDLQVELDINQSDFPKLGPRQKGFVTTDAYPDKKYNGYVQQVSPEADRSKATVQVKVKVTNPDEFLRPDMNATVSFYNPAGATPRDDQKQTAVVIPAGAVQDGAVFVVVNGQARRRSVKTGGTSNGGIVVQTGLIGGEDLILNPPSGMKDGQRVTVAQ